MIISRLPTLSRAEAALRRNLAVGFSRNATYSGKSKPPTFSRWSLTKGKMKRSIAVNDALLSEMVEKMRQAGSPKKIVLFGSRARGNGDPDSDIVCLSLRSLSCPGTGGRLDIAEQLPACLLSDYACQSIVIPYVIPYRSGLSGGSL